MDAEYSAENSDDGLIDAALRGDQRAWTVLVQRYQKPAFRLAYLHLRNSADAEDVTQEALLRAYRALKTFDRTRPFKPWLLQIVLNQTRNQQRSLIRYMKLLQEWRAAQTEPVTMPPIAAFDSETLWATVQQLPPRQESVIYLRYFLELSVAETANVLAISEGTVKSRAARARAQLRRLLTLEA